jgi:hypothetical protein
MMYLAFCGWCWCWCALSLVVVVVVRRGGGGGLVGAGGWLARSQCVAFF